MSTTAPMGGSGKAGITCLHCQKHQLTHHTHDNWTCRFCYAGYLSVPMLSHLLTPELIEQVRDPIHQKPGERPCPLCDQSMTSAKVIKGLHSVEMELCHRCNIAWFDSGKLMQLVRFGGVENIRNTRAESQSKIQELLREALKAQQDQPEPVEEVQFIPWASILIFIGCTLLSPLLSANPVWLDALSFSADAPFRWMGLTWFTSLFVHHRSQMVGILPLVFFGYYVEKRMGTGEFIKMFLVAGLASRILYLGLGKGLAPLHGATPSIAAVVGYGLMMIPYRDFLFPHQSFKSPLQGIQWLVFVGGGILIASFVYDQFNEVLARVNDGRGVDAPLAADKADARWSALHGIGLAMGLIWHAVVPPAPPLVPPPRKS